MIKRQLRHGLRNAGGQFFDIQRVADNTYSSPGIHPLNVREKVYMGIKLSGAGTRARIPAPESFILKSGIQPTNPQSAPAPHAA